MLSLLVANHWKQATTAFHVNWRIFNIAIIKFQRLQLAFAINNLESIALLEIVTTNDYNLSVHFFAEYTTPFVCRRIPLLLLYHS
jgi:hypothetical protein